MTLMGVVNAIVTKLSASTAITSWCTANSFSAMKIFVGLNGKNPPDESDCPYVIVYPSLWTEGEREGEWTWIVVVAWSVKNEAHPVAGRVETLTGIGQCDALGELIWTEVKAACNGLGFPCSRGDYDIEAYEFFPQFPGRVSVMIRVPKVLV